MAGYDFEFYETGRISVIAGQKAFTGNGTAWKIRGCEGAIVIVAGAGAVNFVSSLTTDAAGEFRTAWTGPTLVDATYTMWLPSAVAATALANHQRLAEIIATIDKAQPLNANLTALAALIGAANKGIMLTGAGEAATFDLSPFARPLLGLLTARAFWDAIAGASTLTTPVGRFPLGNGVLFQYGRDVLDPVGPYNPQVLGGTTYYTHYYRRVLPLTYTKWFIVFGSYLAGSFNSQIPSAGRQFNIGRDGTELDRFVMSFTQPGTGAVPAVSWWTLGE